MRFIILLLILPGFCLGQTLFELTPDGLVSKIDPAKKYVVVTMDSASKERLYNLANVALNSMYNNPKAVLSMVENESITITASATKSVHRNSMHVFDMYYSLNLEFRDGRFKINAPSFTLTTYTTKEQKLLLVSNNSFDGSQLGIYNTSGKLKSPDAKKDIEIYFDSLIKLLIEKMDNKQKNDW